MFPKTLPLPLQQLKYVISLLYFLTIIMILYTSCYSVSSVSLHLCTGHHLQSTLYTVLCLSVVVNMIESDINQSDIIGLV
jgi:hypothetical protein